MKQSGCLKWSTFHIANLKVTFWRLMKMFIQNMVLAPDREGGGSSYQAEGVGRS